jgi:putative ABC transport system permease protein
VIGNKIKKMYSGILDSPIGESVDISGIPFKIVGVFKEQREREEETLYIPLTTAQRVFNGGDRISNMSYTLPMAETFDQAVAEAVVFKEELKEYLGQVHTVHPEDDSALEVWSALEEAKRYYSLTGNIKFFSGLLEYVPLSPGLLG